MMGSLLITSGLSIIDHDDSIILSISAAQYQYQYSVAQYRGGETLVSCD